MSVHKQKLRLRGGVWITLPGLALGSFHLDLAEVAGLDHALGVAFGAFNFKHQIAFIKFLGTHAEYDKIDALTVSIY
jgi:mRNA interferase HigB